MRYAHKYMRPLTVGAMQDIAPRGTMDPWSLWAHQV